MWCGKFVAGIARAFSFRGRDFLWRAETGCTVEENEIRPLHVCLKELANFRGLDADSFCRQLNTSLTSLTFSKGCA